MYCIFSAYHYPIMQLNKEIFRLAIPNIISNISIPLLSSVDTILMGHLSMRHLGAVGIASMIFNFVYWNFGFLRMGTTGLTAQAYGEKNPTLIRDTLGRAILVSLSISILLLLCAFPLEYLSFKGMNVIPDQESLVRDYFYIRLLAAPATLTIYALMGWLFGMQNAIYPLIITILINVINIIASYYCVVHLDMEVKGVAYGTVIAQYIGLIFLLALIFFKYTSYFKDLSLKALLAKNELLQFLVLNRDIFIRTVCLTMAFLYFYRCSSSQGEVILAVNLILLQFLNWMSYGIDGLAYASESLVGKYKGANEQKVLTAVIKRVILWGAIFAMIYSLVYWIFQSFLIQIFTNDLSLAAKTQDYMIWMVILPLVAFLSYIWDGIYIGLTASKSMRDLMLVALIVFLSAHQILLSAFNPNVSLWLALMIFLFIRGILQSIWYKRFGTSLR